VIKHRDYEDDTERKWQITFSDMLTLLLTFFVFIIAVSTFKTEEYKRFWETFQEPEQEPPPTKSLKIQLIKGLKIPRLNRDAENLLNELEETFTQSDFEGVDVNYNENKISLIVSEELTFDGGKFDLKEKAKPLILKLISTMQTSPFNVGIEGHTDSLTSEKIDNMQLSLNRALTVARFLIQNGLDKNKVSVSGYGPFRPIAENRRVEGRQRNRRVEINIMINND
jgi:chemotaxis protein MotB